MLELILYKLIEMLLHFEFSPYVITWPCHNYLLKFYCYNSSTMVSNIPLKLIKIGNSKGVIMPKKVLKALNSEKNYFLELKELS